MLLDEYKRRLIDQVSSGKKYSNTNKACEEKIKILLDEISNTAEEMIKQCGDKWNEYDFLKIKRNIDLIFKFISYIKKNYDVINFIKSGKIEEDF